MEPSCGQNYLMKHKFILLTLLMSFSSLAQQQEYRIYHSEDINNEIDTHWKIEIPEEQDFAYLTISDQHSFFNKLILSFRMPDCDDPLVFFHMITPAFRKHEGIIEREDLLNDIKIVMQTDDNPPYWVNARVDSIVKLEEYLELDSYGDLSWIKTSDLLFDIFFIEITKGAVLIYEDDSLVDKLSFFVPAESPYHLYFDKFNLVTFKNNGLKKVLTDFTRICELNLKQKSLAFETID